MKIPDLSAGTSRWFGGPDQVVQWGRSSLAILGKMRTLME